MKQPSARSCILLLGALILAVFATARKAAAADGLLLQDTYVDNASSGGRVPPNQTNYGGGTDLRVFKGSGRIGRAFLKFTLATLPPGTTADDVTQARLRLWVNINTTMPGSVTLTPITSEWDELALKDITAASLTFGLPKLLNLPVSNNGNFVSIDVTDWVKAWLNGTLPNEGFVIEPSAVSTVLNLAFDSKESTYTSHEPRLEIGLSRVGLQGPVGPQGATGASGPQGPSGLAGAPGATGPTGPQGESGPAGPPGVPGANGLNWRGAYAPNVPYTIRDAVSRDGASYLSLVDNNLGHPVTDTTKWSVLAARGETGAEGPTGATGPIGSQGPAGPVGETGASGPQGMQGLTGEPGATGLPGPQGLPGPAAVWPTRIQPQGDLSMGDFTQGPTP